jgi:mRNA interferase MazF
MAAVLEKMERDVQQVKPFRSEVWLADLPETEGSVQKGIRPVVVIQNDVGNRYSPNVIIAPISSKTSKNNIPTHVFLDSKKVGLERDSIVCAEQIITLSKTRLKHKITKVDSSVMSMIDRSIQISLGLSILN